MATNSNTHKTVSISLYPVHFRMLDELGKFWRYNWRSESIRRTIEDAYRHELKLKKSNSELLVPSSEETRCGL
jgi:hypothetical protein